MTVKIVRGVCAGVTLELSATLIGDGDVMTSRAAAAMNAAVKAAADVFFSPLEPPAPSGEHDAGTVLSPCPGCAMCKPALAVSQ